MKVDKRKVAVKVNEGCVPRFLRAIEPLQYKTADGVLWERKIHHYVEWHSGKPSLLVKERSHTKVCLYLDLGTVIRSCCSHATAERDCK